MKIYITQRLRSAVQTLCHTPMPAADTIDAANLIAAHTRIANLEKIILSQQCDIINLRNRVTELDAADREVEGLKYGWEQERNVADMLEAENVALRFALQGLHDDNMDYIKLNHLGAENNHWLVVARATLAKEKP
jgi:hypothetical protein